MVRQELINKAAINFNSDGHCDRPGHNAKYGTYTLMDDDSGKVVAFSVVQVSEVTSSNAMEKEGFKRCIESLEGDRVEIHWIATERHVSISNFMNKEHLQINHQYDVWHVRILLRIILARKLLDFDFLRGLAPGGLDGFSIERYEKNRGSFDLYAAKFESGAMRFWAEKSPRRWNAFKTSFHPCLSIIQNSQRRTQIHSKSLKKPLLRQKDDYTPQVR